MKRLVTALAGVGLMLALAPPAISPAASNTATTLVPLTDGTQLETRAGSTSPHRATARRPPSPDVIQSGIATRTRPLRGPLSTWSCAAATSASG
jgi:hypothetical protein